MMSFADLTKVIPQILKNVAFHDYLSYRNYKFLKDKNFNGLQCYKKQKQDFDDIVYVGIINGKEVFYSLRYNDSGTIIDFVKNRIEVENYDDNFTPEKDHLIEACKELLVYLNERGESILNTESNTTKNDLKTLQKESFTKHFKTQQIFDFKILDHFKINNETAQHALFENKVLNTRGLMFNNTFHDVINLAFPLYDLNEQECGLYYENMLEASEKEKSHFEFFAPFSIKTGLWMSNEIQQDLKRKVPLTIVDRPSEALAHFQYMKENRKYLSVFDLEEISIKQIIKETEKKKSVVYLAFNVSMNSFIKELRLLVALLSVNHDISFLQNNNHDIWFKIGNSESKHFLAFLKRIRLHNNKKVSEVVKVLGRSSETFLANDVIKTSQNENDDLIIKVPKNFKTLYKFEKILIISFPDHIPIQIEKPMYKSWKQQNIKFYEVINEERSLDDYIENEEVFVLSSHRFNN